MLLILGLDGATLDLVGPWVEDGTLPNLAEMIRGGAWGHLASTVPPATFPSWTSFMTGVNPGRHGIFDFTRRERGAYRIRFVNGTFRKAPTVWRLLSQAGRSVSVLGLPGTYPPEPINGYMISGFDTPVTTRADTSFVYPASFAADVERHGGFPFADFQEFSIGRGWHERALASLLDGIERKGRLAEDLLSRQAWDCFMLLMGESDTVAHHFWALHDSKSPRFDPELAQRLGNPIRLVYQALDRLLGRLMTRHPEASVLIASDHGFGGVGNTALYLNRFLNERGWLQWGPGSSSARLAGRLRAAALRAVPERLQARCFRMADGRLASRLESGVRFGGIDWSRTSAFSEELNYAPSIWLNLCGRDQAGVVPATEYEHICAAITEDLLAWRDPTYGSPVVRHVWRRADVYHGEQTELAPDLILDLSQPDGYSYLCLQSGGQIGASLTPIDPSQCGGKLRGMSGSHRSDGLFLLKGDGVRPGEVVGACITDMAPTILYMCGLQPPTDWDGRALPCAQTENAQGMDFPRDSGGEESYYGGAEEALLRQRLTELGYFE
jgi:predicted AlkP superfamily phosphohydrolase/phosphomutase